MDTVLRLAFSLDYLLTSRLAPRPISRPLLTLFSTQQQIYASKINLHQHQVLKKKQKIHSTPGIHAWSPTALLVRRFKA
jgi:hypothetical protein